MSGLTEVLNFSNAPDLSEVGGGHSNKGGEFQKHWALSRIIELEASGVTDFLFLFETIQDVAILDSESAPASISIYQVKKRDRKEWTWSDLTHLKDPSKKKRRSKCSLKNPAPDPVKSPIGKLYAATISFKELSGTGRFISNLGCDIPLSDEKNTATSTARSLSALAADHVASLTAALQSFHDSAGQVDLSCVYLEKTYLPTDDPSTYVIGLVHKFLFERSPRHVGQARSLVDSLLAKIGPLSAKTDSCKDFDELRVQRGFSRGELSEALGALESIPDVLALLSSGLNTLEKEGLTFFETAAIRAAAAGISRRQLAGAQSPQDLNVIQNCRVLVGNGAVPLPLKAFCDGIYNQIRASHPATKKWELYAHILLTTLVQCMDQISGD